MKNKKNTVLFILLLILLCLSLLLFFGIGTAPKNGIQICSFVFLIITEFVVFANLFLITNKKLNTFTVAGLSSATFIYTICSLIFNVILKNIFNSVRGILVFNFSILLIYLLINTIVILFKKEN